MTVWALAILGALLTVLLYPRFDLVWLAPVCLAPLLVAIAREPSWRKRVLFGGAAGVVYWGGVCYWIQDVLAIYAGLSLGLAWISFFLFAFLKGLHWALFSALAGFVIHRPWAVPAIAALWVGVERTNGPFGFAWLTLGNAGIDMGVPMRLAPLVGVYGLSFVFAMMNCAVALLLLRRPRSHVMWLAALPLLYVLPALPEAEEPRESAVVVQPNIEENQEWTTQKVEDTIRHLALLSIQPVRNAPQKPEVILWPEVPAPFYYSDPFFRDQAEQLARLSRTSFLFGAVARTPKGEPLNSAFLLDPGGTYVARYDKVNLVPFGEFVPPVFGWINKISSEAGSFAPGDKLIVFPAEKGRMGVFICYESVFADFVRQLPKMGATVLVNLSNDGYFGRSAAREQHLLLTRMRAAENRRWLIRSTNDGITATVDPAGRVTHRLEPFRRTSARTRFNHVSELTAYSSHGDWFAWLCLAAGLTASAAGYRARR